MAEYIETNLEFKNLLEDEKNKDKLIVIFFTASWCSPCKSMYDFFDKCNIFYTDIILKKIDVDNEECDKVIELLNISSMPTFIFIKNKENLHKFTGASKEKLVMGIENYKNNENKE